MWTRLDRIVFILAFELALAAPSFGQTFGQITGLVTDSTGAVLVGAAADFRAGSGFEREADERRLRTAAALNWGGEPLFSCVKVLRS